MSRDRATRVRPNPAGARTAPASTAGARTASSMMPGSTGAPPTPAAARRRRIAGWSAIVVALLLLASIGLFVQNALRPPETGLLDPQGVGASGAQALARVLEAEGTHVVIVRDRSAALRELGRVEATLVLGDTSSLSDDSLLELVAAASEAVLLQVSSRVPELLIEGAAAAGFHAGEAIPARCELPAARTAGAVVPGRMIELLPEAAAEGAIGCYPGDGAFGLVHAASVVGTPVTLIDAGALFSNAHITEEGNAALALGLLGAAPAAAGAPTLVWYVPAAADGDAGEEPATLGELTPKWVTPAIVLLLCAGIAAGIWRGRRFGPLVAERLPVTVRAAETTEGRARLYARGRDAVHAADQLRIGALERLARALGLGPAAAAHEIADAAAARIGADPGVIRGILLTELPASDAQLVALSDRLSELETAVRRATRPERTQP